MKHMKTKTFELLQCVLCGAPFEDHLEIITGEIVAAGIFGKTRFHCASYISGVAPAFSDFPNPI